MITLAVVKMIGPCCSTAEDGRRIHDVIEDVLNQGYWVDLNFKGVKLVTPSFYNAALGDLRYSFPHEAETPLVVSDLSGYGSPA